jgi:hypothetical protein
MVIRRAIQCISCESKFITRTQVGHKERQDHSFPCPVCGVMISYALDLDQVKGDFKFRDHPKNARWSDTEDGARETLTFSDEILVPIDMGGMFSPHISTFGNYEDFEKYRKDEGLRQLFVARIFPYLERCRVHFERGNWVLFDKESPSRTGDPQTPRDRLVNLYNALHAGFSKFTVNTRGQYDRVLQRLTFAESTSPQLFSALSSEFVWDGHILRLWNEIATVRRAFVDAYPAIQPLYQIYYWKKHLRDLDAVRLSDKRFDLLRQLYIDCFETFCRLMVPAMGIEMIIDHNSLDIPTKKGSMSLGKFEALVNASKREQLRKWPISDLFVAVMDTDLRNGIGHNSAHFDKELDQIVLYDSKGAATISRTMGYTEFCDRVVRLFSAFELAIMYHNGLHLFMNGRFA